MASPKLSRHRQSKIGAIYVVTTVTSRRTPLFRNPLAAFVAIEQIRLCASEGLADNLAWVVMPDHIHWMLELCRGSLTTCIQRFKSQSAREINQALHTSGSLWQPGYYDHYLRNDEDLTLQAQYIVTNPIRAGIVVNMGDYPYWWCRWIESERDMTHKV